MINKEKLFQPWMILVFIGFIILAGILYTVPLGLDNKQDVFFTVSVENNAWTNNPKITNADVYGKPSTILESNYALASFSLWQLGPAWLSWQPCEPSASWL